MNNIIRVMMVEDHPDYREGISFALETVADIDLYLTFGTAERALRSLQDAAQQMKPDVILLDLNLPGMSGIEAIPWFKEYSPDTHLLILSQSNKEADVLEAISAGASGYLLKNAPLGEITDGVRTVLAGGASLDANIAKFILTQISTRSKPSEETSKLSDREMEVLVLIGDGLLKKEISDKLNISVPTVATHVRHIYEKLEVQNAPAAISKAFRTGIFPTSS
ncbi:MAG: response regulator transcription factor [Rubritalea sp.]|uniref:response regulator transcription factor n=1 Tax=Rubritalea sp. TaxID=2109375 RepID=UPI003242AC30